MRIGVICQVGVVLDDGLPTYLTPVVHHPGHRWSEHVPMVGQRHVVGYAKVKFQESLARQLYATHFADVNALVGPLAQLEVVFDCLLSFLDGVLFEFPFLQVRWLDTLVCTFGIKTVPRLANFAS